MEIPCWEGVNVLSANRQNASSAHFPGEERDPWPWSATWPLLMLTLISVFNYLDRSLLGLALPAIKQEMDVSDTALGLVSGLAFVVIYSLLGVPIAWIADRYNRRNIIAIGLTFWSAMTAATGWVSNIWQLAAARFLMGAGEATSTAPATGARSVMRDWRTFISFTAACEAVSAAVALQRTAPSESRTRTSTGRVPAPYASTYTRGASPPNATVRRGFVMTMGN